MDRSAKFMKQADLSIIIVSYNTKELLLNCIKSVEGSDLKGIRHEIIIYDNASTDGTVESVEKFYPQIKIIRGSENIGFARANNAAVKKSTGLYILFINSDTQVNQETLRIIYEFMEKNPNIAASTCKVLLSNGRLDPACHRGFPTPWASLTYLLKLEKLFPKSRIFSRYHMGFYNFEKIHEIDSPSGAFYFVRRQVFFDAGFFDEEYFLYGEDLDLSYRIKSKGYRIFYNPETFIVHYKKQSGRLHRDRKQKIQSDIYFHENNLLFYNKHYATRYPIFLTIIIRTIYNLRIWGLKLFHI